jgi:hypothetical protein
MLDDDGGNHGKMRRPLPQIASTIAKTIRIRSPAGPKHHSQSSQLNLNSSTTSTGQERNNQHQKRHKNNTRTARVRTVVACV